MRKIAESAGCFFRCGPAHEKTAGIRRLPALSMTPPRLRRIEGEHRGRAAYDVEASLLTDSRKSSPEKRREAADAREDLLLDIFTALSRCGRVLAVENLTIENDSAEGLPLGSPAAKAKAEVMIAFENL